MPRSAYAADRAQLLDWICDRLASGTTLQQLAEEPQTPHWNTLMRWQRQDPSLKARFAHARAQGHDLRVQARHPSRFRFPRAQAQTLIDRVRAGSRLSDLVDAGCPDRPTLNAWKRLNPDFAARLADAALVSRMRRRLRRGGGPAYDEDTGDAIVIRVRCGETLRQVCRDPALPAYTVVTRWRRRHPEFDSALKLHKAVAFRAQMAARAGPTEALTEEIGRRIADGASLAQLCAAPDMPHLQTFMRWRRDRPAFAAAVEDACDFRDWVLAGDVVHLILTANTDAARARALACKRRVASLGGRGRKRA